MPYPGNRTRAIRDVGVRNRRQIEAPEDDVRVVNVAFFLDAAHMNRYLQAVATIRRIRKKK